MSAAEPAGEPDFGDLLRQVAQLQSTLLAVSGAGVDAVMVGDDGDERLYGLTPAEQPYRVIVEHMGEGAATLSESGVILYANPQLADFLGVDRDSMVGQDLTSYVDQDQLATLEELMAPREESTRRAELVIRRQDGTSVPFLVAVTDMETDGVLLRCFVLTDLTMQKLVEQQLATEVAIVERQRVAHEVNDTIVQGLVAAEMACDLGHFSQARSLIAATSQHARSWIGELAGDQELEPGMAVRRTPARRRVEGA